MRHKDGQDNLLAPEVLANPHPYFHALRAADPVHWNPMWRGWIVTSYEHVTAGFKEPKLASSRITAFVKSKGARTPASPALHVLEDWMVFTDPPKHTRLRNLVNKAFTVKAVEAMRPRVVEIVDALLDEVASRGSLDVIPEFTFPLPVAVISEMLGLPAEDRDSIKAWSIQLQALVFGSVSDSDRYRRAEEGMRSFAEYVRAAIAQRRADPSEDLISQFIAARDANDQLSEDELIATVILMIFGGHETTTGMIANGLWALLFHEGEWERVRADPTLVPKAVEEMLRFEGPSKAQMRTVVDDVALGNKTLKAGDRVLLVQSAANRDPSQFENPDLFDVTRHPNPHVAFGYGIHYCVGAPLARLEAQVALERLIARFPTLTLDTREPRWGGTIIGRGLGSLRLSWQT